MHISPFLFIATCLVPYVFAHGAPPSQEDSLRTPHAHLRTREDLAEVSNLHRRARPKAAQKPAKPVATINKQPVAAFNKKHVAAVNKKPFAAVNRKHVAAVNKKPLAAVNKKHVAAINKKPLAALNKKHFAALNKKPLAALNKKPLAALNKKHFAALNKKPLAALNKKHFAALNKKPLAALNKKHFAALNKKPLAAVNKKALTAVPKKPAAGANGKTTPGARQAKAVLGTKAAVKQSGTACGRRVHRRSIYNNLYGRTDACEIQLNLKTHTTQEMHTKTIKVRPSENLGASNHGIISTGSRAVYKIDEWDGQQGPFIAKHFNKAEDKSKEVGNLLRVGHLIAASPKGSPDNNSWAVMKHVPGKPLIGSDEHKTAMAKPKNEANDWIKQKHDQLVGAVTKLDEDTGLLHGDLKNDNVHWEHHTDGSSTPHLLDFGQMAEKDLQRQALYRATGVPANQKSPKGYARHRAEEIYPLKQ